MKINNVSLKALQRSLFIEYCLYKHGIITEAEYRKRIRPIDRKIEQLEWSAMYSSFASLK